MNVKDTIILISLYNPKSLGIRCLEKSLNVYGYNPVIIFLKDFNSIKPDRITHRELDLTAEIIQSNSPIFIGISVMTSLYLDAAVTLTNFLKKKFDIPVVWGGVHPTLFPDESLEYADYVIAGEGERAIASLADMLTKNLSLESVPNLVYKNGNEIIHNEILQPLSDLDFYSMPCFSNDNKYFIEKGRLNRQRASRAVIYELSASRGCPFSCTYCCSPAIKSLYAGKSAYLRYRSPSNVVDELEAALKHYKNIKFIHFWDEIFPSNKIWIEEFCHEYKKRIGLPFQIWCHPLTVNHNTIKYLVDAGLGSVVMGIQSGSVKVRKRIFGRSESQQQILDTANILKEAGVPRITYDFMLKHVFENTVDIKHTYKLCRMLPHPFRLQLHGLYFLPGAKITSMAEEAGLTDDNNKSIFQKDSLRDKYKIYWGKVKSSPAHEFWHAMIFFTQFPKLKRFCGYFEKMGNSVFAKYFVILSYKIAYPAVLIFEKSHRVLPVLRSISDTLFSNLAQIRARALGHRRITPQKRHT